MYSTNPINGVAKSPTAPQRQTAENAKPARGESPQVSVETDMNPEAVKVEVQGLGQAPPKGQGEMSESAARPQESVERIHDMVKQANERTSAVKFEIEHDRNNELIVKIVNKNSGDIVREIPPEEIRNMTDKLEELRGILFKNIL
jgi:flagellar protein FlaG